MLRRHKKRLVIVHNMGILETVAVILLVFWLAGLVLHIAGGLIHILLVIAIVLFAVRFLRGSSSGAGNRQ